MVDVPTIPEFFKNKTVFITGGSGFIGKVLIEKLLRSCPDLDKIYLLMRNKRGKSPEERIRTMTDIPLFDLLKSQQPSAINKLRLVPGDATQLGLGMSPEDRTRVVRDTHVIYHAAASVRFDDPLAQALIMNTRSTREVMHLALEMQQLEVLLHISTTYCLTDHEVIGECLYPAHTDWSKAIEVAENYDKDELNILTAKYIEPLPNTYTFAKSLAEHVVYDLGNKKIPQVIIRPSIVISTVKEPMPGWIDNFNGPVGLLVASGKGLVRTMYADPDLVADYIPVDLVAKGLIISAWKKATARDPEEKLETSFYNGSNNGYRSVTFREVVTMGKQIAEKYPMENLIWYPSGSPTKCIYLHYIRLIIFHLLPALFIDTALRIAGYKPLVLKIQRKIFVANMAISYFVLNHWQFKNENSVGLEKTLLPNDEKEFSFYKDEVTEMEYFEKAAAGGLKYLLKEGNNIEGARRHANRMWYLAEIANILWYLFLFWIVYSKLNILGFLNNKYEEWYVYLTTD